MTPVYLLHGQNSVDLDDRVQALLRDLDPNNVASSTLDTGTSAIDQIANACHSAPFFGSGRTVILRNVSLTAARSPKRPANVPEWPDLLNVIETSPPTTSIVLRSEETLGSTSVVMKAAKRLDWKVEAFPMPRGEDLARWVAERGQLAGVSIGRAAATNLLVRLYPTSWRQESRFDNTVLDARLIATEVEKLACATMDGTVSEDLVTEMIADRSGYTAFKLNDLVYSGQSAGALTELEQVLSSGDEPERILAQFASEAVGLASAGSLQEFDPATVSKASGISEGRLRMLRQKPASRDRGAIASAIERLRMAEWLVKTGRAPRGESVIVATAAEVAESFRRAGR